LMPANANNGANNANAKMIFFIEILLLCFI